MNDRSRPPQATQTALVRHEYETKTAEQAIRAEIIVITRLKVTEELGVTWKSHCGLSASPKAAIPSTIGMRLPNFSITLLLERTSITPAIQNATSGKNR